MAFRAGGTNWQTFQQGTQGQQVSPAERAQAKAVTISEQERLIEQKKKEIQQKMAEKKKKEEEAKGGAKKATAAAIKFNIGLPAQPPAKLVPTTAEAEIAGVPTPAATVPAPVVGGPEVTKPAGNIFSNDGSFLEQFRKMQEQNQKGEKSEESKPSLLKTNLSDIPLPDPPKPNQELPTTSLALSSTPTNPPQPIAFSTASSHTRKSTLPVPKPSAFRDSDDEDDNVLAAILPPDDPELLTTVNRLAQEVAEGGLMVEETAKKEHKDEELYRFLFDHDCPEHKYYQKRLVEMRLAKKVRTIRETRQAAGNSSEGSRKRKSRWMEGGPGDSGAVPPPKITIIPPGSVGGASAKPGVGGVGGTGMGLGEVEENDWGFGSGGGVSTSSLGNDVNRVGMIGTTELSPAQLKQLKEQQEMQRMVDSMVKYHNKIAAAGRSAANQESGPRKKNKYEYDSDEDTHGGTWEHKQRMLEMEETRERAEILTRMGKGKHHLGDFLPPDELEKFLETLQALKEGRTPDFSDYQKFKIQADNIGYQMLKKLGWEEGKGLGSTGQGITAPVNKGSASAATTGLGIDKASNLTKEDAEDEYSAYRKRMMLAYRFRPNPLNNPRRPYY
ncbi:SURP and G-patch domain-containing protein 1-like [Acanthaster planci]|uniref:SURP and G-patch domain-containing protein 1-like n=1 Tax=Acanthaster planci TaxID=133434 RepID=A0A8B7Y373_ACAPL|nr:SURP and G-patch domain-containing protein 1-like [Acanthaster planci]XP_022086973.1 SURP and G-patch domain-containing protein 1-like [Acanthaster planci]